MATTGSAATMSIGQQAMSKVASPTEGTTMLWTLSPLVAGVVAADAAPAIREAGGAVLTGGASASAAGRLRRRHVRLIPPTTPVTARLFATNRVGPIVWRSPAA